MFLCSYLVFGSSIFLMCYLCKGFLWVYDFTSLNLKFDTKRVSSSNFCPTFYPVSLRLMFPVLTLKYWFSILLILISESLGLVAYPSCRLICVIFSLYYLTLCLVFFISLFSYYSSKNFTSFLVFSVYWIPCIVLV